MTSFKRLNNITGWILFAIALIVYTMTMEATASFWDCGEFISATYKLQVVHPPGAPIFLMVGRIFSLFASSPEQVPTMTNFFSALSSAFAVLFCFWIITRMAKKMLVGNGEVTGAQTAIIIFTGIIGAGCCIFMDSMWFSAVESEVYALATFFFAIIFWAMIKWEETADQLNSDRWILFMALMMGLSMGVHLLALLVIPAICLIYYFKNYKYTAKGFWATIGIGIALVAIIFYGILDKFIAIGTGSERMFVNGFGAPFGTGMIIYTVIIFGAVIWGIRRAIQKGKRMLYLGLMSFVMLMIGLSSYAMVLIRADAQPPINMNGINDVHSFLSYLKREQYGSRAIFYGPYWTAQPSDYKMGKTKYGKVEGNKKYVPVAHDFEPVYDIPEQYLQGLDPKQADIIRARNKEVLFPRMGSMEGRHEGLYYDFAGVDESARQTYEPSWINDNMSFFFRYQLGHMFWRYFMWNFSGRQNDTQGNFYDGYKDGNWITGIEAIDKRKNEQLQDLPPSFTDLVSHNTFFMLPFIIGILGMTYQLRKDWKGFLVVMLFFIFMGFMNIINMNQPPTEPRERDYAQIGAFFAFAIWIGFGLMALVDLARNFKSKTIQEYAIYSSLIMLGMFFTGLTMYNLPSFFFVLVYTLAFIGLAAFILSFINKSVKKESVVGIVALLICLPAPVLMAQQGWDDHDRSDRTFARDIARNYLESCPPNAILFTQGDNDTYPLWYAQEVEGIRTDVRIVNLSLLGVDWYINLLRHSINDAPTVNLILSQDKVLGDKRNQISGPDKSKLNKQTFELSDFVKFIGSDNTKYQTYNDVLQDYVNYVPSQNIRITTDPEKMKANHIVPESLIENSVKEMDFKLRNGGLLKNDIMTLDIVASNINERPICFAISVTGDSHLGLEKYLMQRNMVYQLLPVELENDKSVMDGYRKNMNTDIQYDLLVNQKEKFTYGGVERGKKMYIDPSGMGSILTTKYLNYLELAKSLNDERTYLEAQAKQMMKDSTNNEFNEVGKGLLEQSKEKKQKALATLDLMITLFPNSSVPYDYNMINVAQLYLQLDAPEKAMDIVKTMTDRNLSELNYFYEMSNMDEFTADMFNSDTRQSESATYLSIDIAKRAGDTEFADNLQGKWEAMRTKYGLPPVGEQRNPKAPK